MKPPDWKSLSLLDEDLVQFLKKKYPPNEYTQGQDKEEFAIEAIFRAGQREVIHTLEHIIELQRKETRNG